MLAHGTWASGLVIWLNLNPRKFTVTGPDSGLDGYQRSGSDSWPMSDGALASATTMASRFHILPRCSFKKFGKHLQMRFGGVFITFGLALQWLRQRPCICQSDQAPWLISKLVRVVSYNMPPKQKPLLGDKQTFAVPRRN